MTDSDPTRRREYPGDFNRDRAADIAKELREVGKYLLLYTPEPTLPLSQLREIVTRAVIVLEGETNPHFHSDGKVQHEIFYEMFRRAMENGKTTALGEALTEIAHLRSRAPLTVSEEVRQRAVKVVWEAGSQTWGESWEDAHALRRPSTVRAGVIVDAVLAVLRAGRSEGDGKP